MWGCGFGLFFAGMQHTLINKGYNGWSQLGIFLGLWGGGLIMGSLGAGAVWAMMTGQGLMNMEQDMLNPAYANAVKAVQLITTLFVFFLPALAYAFICWRPPLLALGFKNVFNWKVFGICLLIILASSPLIDLLTTINKAIPLPAATKAYFDKLEQSYEQQVKAIGDVRTFGQYVVSMVMIAALPAFFEEVMFRGGLQNLFARWWKNPWAAIVVTAVLFSAIHGSWYGFLPRVALGVVLGLVFHFTKNIWYTVGLHFINNGVIVTYMYVSAKMNKESNMSDVIFPWWAGLIAAGVLYLLIRQLKKMTANGHNEQIFFDRKNPFDSTGINHMA